MTFWDPMDCSLPGSFVHGILQARILVWVAYPSPEDLPNPGIKPGSPALQANSLPAVLSTLESLNLSPKCSRKPALFFIFISCNTVSPSRCRVHAYLHISWDGINPFALVGDLLSKALEVHIYISNVKIKVRVPFILMFLGGDWTTNYMEL